MRYLLSILVAVCGAISSPALAADGPRELLVSAAFDASSKPVALSTIERALKAADEAIARDPGDREARLHRAVAISYRGKLRRNRADLAAARSAFEALVASNPRDAEAQMGLAGWHLGAIIELGPLMARTMLGARKEKGLQALNRALALGSGRAFFPAYASLTRIQLDPHDVAGARRLAEDAVKAPAPAPIDRVMQRRARTFLASLAANKGKAAAKAAERLLPFGRLH